MSNPFLFDDDDVEPSGESAPNPFLLSNTGEEDASVLPPPPPLAADEAENPFLAEAANPFAFNEEDNSAQQNVVEVPKPSIPSVDKAMSFFGTTITEDDDHEPVEPPSSGAFVVTELAESEKAPPPRPTPPNPTTQDLISSVADQMDQNSSHLLDRIPKTRTPSPVSMRDLHSPSPTPDSANLLMSDSLELGSAASNNILRSDNPFADVEDEPIFQPEPTQSKGPSRPIPPRPTPPPNENKPAPEVEADLFDFGTNTAPPKPPAPKSNQDILSLFAAPKAAEPPKPDLLTSDILMMGSVAPVQSNLPQQVIPNVTAAPVAPVTTVPPVPPVPVAPIVPIVQTKKIDPGL